jgi:hypothetical protein
LLVFGWAFLGWVPVKIFALSVAAAALGAAMTFSGAASASQIVTCTGIYNGAGTAGEANGTVGLPGTDVGTVSPGCQIGATSQSDNSGDGIGAFITTSNKASIYQFTWGGGDLTITEDFGNMGSVPSVDVELGLLAGNTLNASLGLANWLDSVNFNNTDKRFTVKTIFTGDLAAGTYVIDSFAGTVPNDPVFQINFTAVPEPMSLTLLGAGLIGAGVLRRKKSKKATVI